MRTVTISAVGVGKVPSNVLDRSVIMENLLTAEEAGRMLAVGVAIIPPGVRVPGEGMGVHDADEISYIVSGKITAGTASETRTLSAGTVTFLAAGETHWSCNDSCDPATIFWVLVNPPFPLLRAVTMPFPEERG
ncbi:MAG: cupin domain-containing protein [Firmicutes bacterium]|nr:cupin domain-containing protein [Bacillota bacterium]